MNALPLITKSGSRSSANFKPGFPSSAWLFRHSLAVAVVFATIVGNCAEYKPRTSVL